MNGGYPCKHILAYSHKHRQVSNKAGDQGMTFDELTVTLKEIDHKSFSLDGYLCEFYNATWHFVGLDLLQYIGKLLNLEH